MTTVIKVRERAERDARSHGYYLNPDPQFLGDLLEGLKQNEERYDYPLCPCRLSSGKFEFDRDIICPCDYRDPDVEEYGHCYCALYVNKDVFDGRTSIQPIPERRPPKRQLRAYTSSTESSETTESNIKLMLWYCTQCGYLCYREDPPPVCPICKAKKEMFNKIQIRTEIHG